MYFGHWLKVENIESVASSPPSSSPDRWQLPRVLRLHPRHLPPGKYTTFNSGVLKPLFLPPDFPTLLCTLAFHFLLCLLTTPCKGTPLKEDLRALGDNGMHSLIDNKLLLKWL